MLKADVIRFENLASADESVRVQAALQLQQLNFHHFYDHPVGKFRYSAEKIKALLSAWNTTSSELVKVWIAQSLALTDSSTPEVLAVLADALPFDGPYMPSVAQILLGNRKYIPNWKQLFKSLHLHPNGDMRRQSAMALRFSDDYDGDMPILRRLMLDVDPTVRNDAVLAASEMSNLGPDDYEVLLDMVNLYSGNAILYAKELITKLERTVPGCTQIAFAPREPHLHTNGVYSVNKAELDSEGAWVSKYCLRFFPDGTVHSFGTNEALVDLPKSMNSRAVASGTVVKDGGRVVFSVANAEGVVDFTGQIEGSTLNLKSKNRDTGRCAEDCYEWSYLDWSAKQAEPPEQMRKTSKKQNKLPFTPVPPRSMRISDASKWYVQMLARLPSMLDGVQSEQEKVALAWRIKSQIRDTAANASFDPKLKKKFFEKMPLPDFVELQEQEPAIALKALLTVTLAERRAFPGTVGEFIGLEYWDANQTCWVMTEEGWALRSTPAC